MRPTYTLSLLSCLLLAAGAGYAQQPRFGVKAGLNASTYAGANLPDTDHRLGPSAGVLVQLPIGPHVDLQPELLYEQRGVRSTYTGRWEGVNITIAEFTRTVRTRLHYVSLPVLVRVHRGAWFALAGPQLSYLIAEKRISEEQIEIRSSNIDPILPAGASPQTVHAPQNYHRAELGYVLGVGYEINSRWRVEGRYAAGATKVRQPSVELHDTIYGSERLEKARNNSLQLQVSYLLSSL
jgi:hypothetical protein